MDDDVATSTRRKGVILAIESDQLSEVFVPNAGGPGVHEVFTLLGDFSMEVHVGDWIECDMQSDITTAVTWVMADTIPFVTWIGSDDVLRMRVRCKVSLEQRAAQGPFITSPDIGEIAVPASTPLKFPAAGVFFDVIVKRPNHPGYGKNGVWWMVDENQDEPLRQSDRQDAIPDRDHSSSDAEWTQVRTKKHADASLAPAVAPAPPPPAIAPVQSKMQRDPSPPPSTIFVPRNQIRQASNREDDLDLRPNVDDTRPLDSAPRPKPPRLDRRPSPTELPQSTVSQPALRTRSQNADPTVYPAPSSAIPKAKIDLVKLLEEAPVDAIVVRKSTKDGESYFTIHLPVVAYDMRLLSSHFKCRSIGSINVGHWIQITLKSRTGSASVGYKGSILDERFVIKKVNRRVRPERTSKLYRLRTGDNVEKANQEVEVEAIVDVPANWRPNPDANCAYLKDKVLGTIRFDKSFYHDLAEAGSRREEAIMCVRHVDPFDSSRQAAWECVGRVFPFPSLRSLGVKYSVDPGDYVSPNEEESEDGDEIRDSPSDTRSFVASTAAHALVPPGRASSVPKSEPYGRASSSHAPPANGSSSAAVGTSGAQQRSAVDERHDVNAVVVFVNRPAGTAVFYTTDEPGHFVLYESNRAANLSVDEWYRVKWIKEVEMAPRGGLPEGCHFRVVGDAMDRITSQHQDTRVKEGWLEARTTTYKSTLREMGTRTQRYTVETEDVPECLVADELDVEEARLVNGALQSWKINDWAVPRDLEEVDRDVWIRPVLDQDENGRPLRWKVTAILRPASSSIAPQRVGEPRREENRPGDHDEHDTSFDTVEPPGYEGDERELLEKLMDIMSVRNIVSNEHPPLFARIAAMLQRPPVRDARAPVAPVKSWLANMTRVGNTPFFTVNAPPIWGGYAYHAGRDREEEEADHYQATMAPPPGLPARLPPPPNNRDSRNSPFTRG